MSGGLKLQDISIDVLREMPFVEIAHQLLEELNEPVYYRELMIKIAAIRKMSQEEIDNAIASLYTDINIDGRFLCIGDNVWGLRRWYPMEKTTERGAGKRFMRKDIDFDDEEEDDVPDLGEEEVLEDPPFGFEEEEEEEVFTEDELEENGFQEEEADPLEEEELELEEEEENEEEF